MDDETTGQRRIRQAIQTELAKRSPIQKTVIGTLVASLLGGGICAGLELSVRLGDTEVHIHDVGDHD